MIEKESRQELREKLIRAGNIEEVRSILGSETPQEEIDQVWREIEAYGLANDLEAVDDDELEAVSGGARDWENEGCYDTVVMEDWCWFNDYCSDVFTTYSNADDLCANGWKGHDWSDIQYINAQRHLVCTRCGKAKLSLITWGK